MKKQWPRNYGIQQKQFEEATLQQYNPTLKTREISNKQPNLSPKAIRERRAKKPQSYQKKRNHKVQIRNK